MKETQPQLEKAAQTPWLIHLGRMAVAALLVVAVWQTLSGWKYLFAPAATPVRQEPAQADRWDRLPLVLAASGHWRVLGSAWTADFRKTSPQHTADGALHVQTVPTELPALTNEEQELVGLLTQITSPSTTSNERIQRRETRLSWGTVVAATTRAGEMERLLEVVVSIGDKSAGYCIRIYPNDAQVAASNESLNVAMPKTSLRLGTKINAENRAVCEVWMTSDSLDALLQNWQAAGWSTEASPSSQRSTACMLSRGGEAICALLPAGRNTTARRDLIVFVRLSEGASQPAGSP